MTRVLWFLVFVCVVQCLPMSQDELEDFSNFLLKTSSLDIHVKTGADPDASFDEDEEVSDHAWEESGKFEGDLILNDRQRRLIVENVEGLSRNGLTDSTKRWPNNEVIYFIQREHFTSGQVQAIQDGIDDLARASCVKFRPYRRGDQDAVVIQGSRRGCFSQVGYQGGYQVLNLSGRHPVGRGCFRHGTVVHELLHSLGFYHMQSSPDRDDYIDVVWANIVQPARHNFRKYNSFSVSDFGVGYDYDSVLHYSRRAFSANGQDTLVPKKSGAQIGQRAGLSDKDTQKLNKMYCDADNDPSVQSDENPIKKPINKKKKPKNQPFEGHGIGYHQGKTVVIRLPAAETYKLPNVPSTNVFDFSKTPQVVPPEAAGYRFGEEITYSYKPIYMQETDTIKEYNDHEVKPIVVGNKNTDLQNTEEDAIPHTEDKDGPSSSQDSYEIKPEYVPIDDYDRDLKYAFDRLTKIVKQHIYPQGKGYEHMINKDYSKFFVPLQNKKSDSLNYYSNDKLEPPTSFETSKITPLKQTVDVSIETSANDKIRNNQIQDRENQSFRTALPTKQPYSLFEQTETPHYATLEYLKNRNDYSNLYSLKIPDSSSIEEHSGIPTAGKKYKEDIKINPYDGAFYTDYTHRNIKGISTDAPIQESTSEEVKPHNHLVNNRSQKIRFGEVKDSSYRTLLPTNMPYSAYEQTETNYATLEYLKDRHKISHSHHPEKIHVETNDSANDHPPTEGDWYIKNSNKHNPANYDHASFSVYVQPEQKEHDGYNGSGDARKSTGDPSDIQNTSTYESGDKEKENYYKKENERLTDGNFDNNKNKEAASNLRHSHHDREHEYFGHDDKKDNDTYTDEDEERKKNDDDSQHHFQDFLTISSYSPNYDEEHNSSSVETSKEDESEVAPRKSQAYTLYDVPVPLANDWYKISYTGPEISKVNENTS